MIKNPVSIVIFSFFLFLPLVQADVLDDFEIELARVAQTGNYKNALNAPDTRFAKEYELSLSHLERLGRKLDRSISSFLPENHFSFQSLSRSLTGIYNFNTQKMRHPENFRKNRKNEGKKNRKNDLKNILQDPVAIFKLLQNDIKILRKAGYSEEKGFGGMEKNPLAGTLFSYQHSFRTFVLFRHYYFRKKVAGDFRKEFDSRLKSFQSNGIKLQNQLGRYAGRTASPDCNIARETSVMIRNFEKYREMLLKGRRGSGKNTTASSNREILHSQRKIDETLSLLERNGLGKSHFTGGAAFPGRKKTLFSYEDMDQSSLEKELLKRRQTIYKGNTLMDGFDKDSLRKYLLTLTPDEKKFFDQLRKDRIKAGSRPEGATRTAILAIHSEGKIRADAKTLRTLLLKLDKEEERLREKER